MQFDPPIWRYIPKACPCCGEGSLAFYACPECSFTLLVCDELGTVFSDPRNLDHAAPRKSGDPACLCPGCKNVPIMEFRPASSDEIAAAGILPGEYE